MKSRYVFLGVLLLVFVVALVGGNTAEAASPMYAKCQEPTPPEQAMNQSLFFPRQLTPCTGYLVQVPFMSDWANSPHNDTTAMAFTYASVKGVNCAKCHTTEGYLDFLGADGTTPNKVDNPAPKNNTIQCVACHNPVTLHKTAVTFPSGVTIEDLGDESRCMECHQGRESGKSVDNLITTAAPTDDDTPTDRLGFVNIHYFAAASTMYGSLVNGGYEYAGKDYDPKFHHVDAYDQCYECHDPHTLEIDEATCATCHTDGDAAAASMTVFSDYRMAGSLSDYDGDGNITEGIVHEIEALSAMLLTAIEAYAQQYSVPIMYDETSHPYWFYVTNGAKGAAYDAFTSRLLKACYNYQVAHKDPGQFTHNAKYIIQLLYDSIADLNTKIANPVSLANAHRDDAGHFAGSNEAFRDWDSEGEVPGRCARCHSSEGLPLYHEEGVNISAPTTNGFKCTTCHVEQGGDWARLAFDSATFPSGAVVSFGADNDSNLCLQCHQGRESGMTVATAIAGFPAADIDVVKPTLATGGVRLHYLATGATWFGNLGKAGYEYEGMTYDSKYAHVEGYDTCAGCHDAHTLEIKLSECKTCHTNVTTAADFANIRMAGSLADYDGDGNVTEGVGQEIDGLKEKLWAAIRAYASQKGGKAIAFDGSRFYVDANDNGVKDTTETTRYNAFTPRLLKATYNYYIVANIPAQFAHGGKYIIQLVYDSIMDLNTQITPQIDMTNAHRGDPGHFNGSKLAWRDWDGEAAVPASCARCHSAEGVPVFKQTGANVDAKHSNGLMCSTCHDNLVTWTRIKFDNVTFPSGAVLSLAAQDGDGDSNLCLLCHQGRSWSGRITADIAGKDLDTIPTPALSFRNVHYFAAGATLFGNDAKGIYQFDGKTYRNRFAHVPNFDACSECHGVHELNVKETQCTMCHGAFASLQDIRFPTSFADYDGDGNLTEGIYYEIETMAEKLYTALKAYGVAIGKPIVYDAHNYPYFVNDTNGNGIADPAEAVRTNGYSGFTPRSLRAAYNYQYYQKDPGQFAHNGKYVLQALYDNLEDLNASPLIDVDMTGLVRP